MRGFFNYLIGGLKVGQNIDQVVVLAIIACTVIASSFGPVSESALYSLTLAVLAFISIGSLITRYQINQINEGRSNAGAIEFFDKKPNDFRDLMHSFKSADFLGFGLRSTIHDNFYVLKERVEDGAKLRIIIVNPHAVNMDVVVSMFSRGGAAENFLSDYESIINQISSLAQHAVDFQNVRLRVIDFVPAFSLHVFPNRKVGRLFFETYCFQSQIGQSPRYWVSQSENNNWYSHFASQYEKIWDYGHEIDLSPNGRYDGGEHSD